MNKMIKKIAVSATTAVSILAASYAVAGNFFEERIYFATSAKVTVVGEKIIRCDGSHFNTGTITPYYRVMNRSYCGGDLN